MEETVEARIGRYLSGEMTFDEKEAFEGEIDSNPVLKENYMAISRLWENALAPEDAGWNTENAWQRFSATVGSEGKVKFRVHRTAVYRAVAAGIIVILGTYALFFRPAKPVTYAYAENTTMPLELKDGSKVYLNRDSEITVYPFSRKKRHIELHGEAFFEIRPDVKRPFTILTGKTLTEVVGTSFNIREDADQTTILVSSGKVIFSSTENEKMAVALAEGEAAVYDDQRMQMIPNPSPNINAWRTRQLQFRNTSFEQVISDIAAYFGQEIIIENEAVRGCTIGGSLSFSKPELRTVLNAVARTINAKVVREGEQYLIQGGNCF